jgi:hypothetical protein
MPASWPTWVVRLFGALLLMVLSAAVRAQQLEPRAFAPNPVGLHFVIASAAHSEGQVFVDASSPIQDFQVNLNVYSVGYGRTFALGDRLASLGIVVPYAHGHATGRLNGVDEAVTRDGPGDLALRFTASLLPGSALDPRSFARAPPETTLGASLVIVAPTGEYLHGKLINISAHRWGFKPELGGSRQFGRWEVDGSIGAWFYTDNNDFLGGLKRSQDPIGAIQAHVSYTFRPRLWLGADFTWYAGGESKVDGVSNKDSQNNTRAGLTLAMPLTSHQSLKLSWSTGTSTRIGGSFDSVNLSWQYFWFD